ncbi:MAG: competence/damage-inducible protein A [Thermoleophilia bacterium]|nr:competence/damage-inducible protein A [Thermoleophilia bacterium]
MNDLNTSAELGKTHTAEIIFTGDELLRGDTVNTNQVYLGERFLELGILVTRAACVLDELSDIVQAIQEALSRKPSVLVLSGGLGPTEDDLTREAVAAATGRSLEFHEELLEQIRERFAARSLPMSESNRKQAFLPQGAHDIPFLGTAPGFWMLHGPTIIVALPGVPWELEHMWENYVQPMLEERLEEHQAICVRRIRTFGLGESVIASRLSGLNWRSKTLSIGTRAALDGVTVILRGRGDQEGREELERVTKQIVSLLEPNVYSLGRETLPEVVGATLQAQGLTVAVAESCTGGLLGRRLTDVPGSSRYFLGGVIAYDNRVKERLLGVPAELLASKGAVSQEVAEAMAQGVRHLLGTDCGLATTGIAGPEGGTPEKPVGLVFVACATSTRVTVEKLRLFGERNQIRERAAYSALDLLRRELAGLRTENARS